MKEYKVETIIKYSKLTTDREHIAKSTKEDIQLTLDKFTRDGWILTSTDATSFGGAMYIYLYFERNLQDLI